MSDKNVPALAEPSSLARMLLFAFAGALCFIAAGLVLAAWWRLLPGEGGDSGPWFLSSGRSRLLTQSIVACGVFAAGVSVRMSQRLRLACGMAFFAGASVAMAGVLLVRGPGAFWPLVFLAALLYLAAATAAGLIPAILVTHAREARRPGPRPSP